MTGLARHMRFMAAYHRHANASLLAGISDAFPSEFNDFDGAANCPAWSTTTFRRTPRVSYYRQDSTLFFRSIHGTLNHILGAETLWWHRLAGSSEAAADIASLYALHGRDLSSAWENRIESRRELFGGLHRTAAAWEELVATGVAREGQLDEVADDGAGADSSSSSSSASSSSSSSSSSASGDDLIGDEWFLDSVTYDDTDGQPTSVVRAAALAQIFNHATHHRGQITAAFTKWGEAFPSLDLQGMGDGFTHYDPLSPGTRPVDDAAA